jgi:hypothetical protein
VIVAIQPCFAAARMNAWTCASSMSIPTHQYGSGIPAGPR